MVNQEHIELLLRGQDAIKVWKKNHPHDYLDLSEADLRSIDINGLDLSGSDLVKANLYGNFFDNTNLSNANLSGAILNNGIFNWTILKGANLHGSICYNARFNDVDLSEANLVGIDLFSSYLVNVDLTHANLTDSLLEETSFIDVNFSNANFSNSRFYKTTIVGSILSHCIGLNTIKHLSPSSLGIDTIINTFKNNGNRFTSDFTTFCNEIGVPREVLNVLPRALSKMKFHSCFISYGDPDTDFATKIVTDLRYQGVSCWLYSIDATPGERTWREISQNRREAEKMILLCSAESLIRDGVLKEIEEQIDEDPEKIIPISLDDLWKERGFRVMRADRDLKPFLIERNYVDFNNELTYSESFERLLRALKHD